MNKIILKDIIDILNSDIELYFKGKFIGEFTKETLRESKWINERVVGIETDEESKICICLSDYNRVF